MRSDNGGNFVKGEKELRQEIEKWNQNQIHDFLVQRSIKWTFIPPAGSHHGGVWERCIRTVGKVMRAITKEQLLDDEGLNTLMCEVEAIVNGRPLTKLSDDPNDLRPLTPKPQPSPIAPKRKKFTTWKFLKERLLQHEAMATSTVSGQCILEAMD
ncbi:uncharacterized protein LOC114525108 [Dendronephthya gigantea]|uniref:uncharacterized protein LOC114525108 n=1 Tax=Dendronephthya gigantea TaxID=151771 RepID=UPI00106BFDDF|nr:uncharacterized protein LOC114525108 [Dendronephthya gigantea]